MVSSPSLIHLLRIQRVTSITTAGACVTTFANPVLAAMVPAFLAIYVSVPSRQLRSVSLALEFIAPAPNYRPQAINIIPWKKRSS